MVAAKGVAGIRELLELLRERVWQRASSSTYATLSAYCAPSLATRRYPRPAHRLSHVAARGCSRSLPLRAGRAQAKVSEADVSSFLAEAVGPLLSFDPDGPLPPPSDRTPYLALTTTYATPTEFRTGLVRNYEAPQEELASLARFTVTEALKATTAAPTYLPPLIKDGRFYFDGGLVRSAPAASLLYPLPLHLVLHPLLYSLLHPLLYALLYPLLYPGSPAAPSCSFPTLSSMDGSTLGAQNANSPSFEALVEFNRLFPGKRVSALTVSEPAPAISMCVCSQAPALPSLLFRSGDRLW